MADNLRMRPRGVEAWEFNAFKGSEQTYGSWATRGAHETEAAVYLTGLADGRYTRVVVTYHKSHRGHRNG